MERYFHAEILEQKRQKELQERKKMAYDIPGSCSK